MEDISSYVLDKTYRFSAFNSKNYNKFFFNDFMHNSIPDYNNDQQTHHGFGELDKQGEYVLNTYGYRSKPFKDNTEVIFAGDSFTYGVGIPEDGIWASRVGKHFNFDYVNMGWPGGSVTGIVGNLMHYFKVHGNPKYLFCMFPDLARMHFFLNKNIMMSSISESDGFQEIQLSHLNNYNERPKYAKKPYNVQEVFPNETAYYHSLKAIQFLEQYCDASGIKFLWSFFHGSDHEAMDILKDNEFGYYKNFLNTKQHLWKKDEDFNDYVCDSHDSHSRVDCHLEEAQKYGTSFL